MVEFDGEIYLIATKAAKYIGISRCQFYSNVKPYVHPHKIGGRRRLHYRRSDLEQFRVIEVAA